MAGSKQSAANLKKIKQLNKQYKDLNEELKKLHTKVELAVKLKRDVDKFKQKDEVKGDESLEDVFLELGEDEAE